MCFFECVALWGSCDCAVFVLLRARRFSWFLRSSLCLRGLCCFPCCLPPLWCSGLSFLPPLPRVWSCVRPGPACTPVCWCLPLGICCICDGPVALLHAWSVVKLQWDERQRWLRTRQSVVWPLRLRLDYFFSVQRRMASARSFNMFPSMLHIRLIN